MNFFPPIQINLSRSPAKHGQLRYHLAQPVRTNPELICRTTEGAIIVVTVCGRSPPKWTDRRAKFVPPGARVMS